MLTIEQLAELNDHEQFAFCKEQGPVGPIPSDPVPEIVTLAGGEPIESTQTRAVTGNEDPTPSPRHTTDLLAGLAG